MPDNVKVWLSSVAFLDSDSRLKSKMSKNTPTDFGFDLPARVAGGVQRMKQEIETTKKGNQSQFGSMGAAASFAFVESLV